MALVFPNPDELVGPLLDRYCEDAKPSDWSKPRITAEEIRQMWAGVRPADYPPIASDDPHGIKTEMVERASKTWLKIVYED